MTPMTLLRRTPALRRLASLPLATSPRRHALRAPAPILTRSIASSSSSPPSSTSDSPPRVRRPSPYRLPALPTFLASFAPLHASGWRLEPLPSPTPSSTPATHSAAADLLSGADLQGRRMVRAFAFPRDREGWRALCALMGRIGAVVEELDHHPVLLAAPASDLPPDVAPLLSSSSSSSSSSSASEPPAAYVLYIATHTHTPMPPLGVTMEGKPAPGVTGKDLALAERVEAAFEAGRGVDGE